MGIVERRIAEVHDRFVEKFLDFGCKSQNEHQVCAIDGLLGSRGTGVAGVN